ATNRDLAAMVREGKFREDLFYRLAVIPIDLPPLYEREGDVPLLIHHFLRVHGGQRSYSVSAGDMSKLEAYEWPGNVRELENAVKRAIALAGSSSEVSAEHMIQNRLNAPTPLPNDLEPDPENPLPLREVVESVEKRYILAVLKMANFSKDTAAEILGISRKNLWEKRKKYGIDEE
ncbi:MAG: sigma-54-dependent Fis family transcriptional regulator, partial [Planctomycetes bacterium]|nr:sigma-54-dependent Fis family transcriptional regulator [Planctomycetota bacterium]